MTKTIARIRRAALAALLLAGTQAYAVGSIQVATPQVAVSPRHSLAIDEQGTLWAWGANELGQLGNGDDKSRETPYPIGTGFKRVAAGNWHSFAIRDDGSLWAWGVNDQGQLGVSTVPITYAPVRVGDGFTEISAGALHVLALKSDGSLWAWGWNANATVGDGTRTDRRTPVSIGYGFTKISAGTYHSLGVKGDGTLWAWGANDYGQLGTGDPNVRTRPTQMEAGVIDISAAGTYSLALKNNGSLWSWGQNTYGQLGNGSNTNIFRPTRVGLDYQKLAASGSDADTQLAIKSRATLTASGRNDFAQFGNGTTNSTNRPQVVGEGFAQIAASKGHVVAIKTDKTFWSWGRNESGQLGDGTNMQRIRPVKVVFPSETAKPVPTTYIDFSGKSHALFAWEGRYVTVLSKSNALSPAVMTKWLKALDQAHQYYSWTTEFKPNKAKTYNGKITIAEVPITCGAGCGYLSETGIEILSEYFLNGYNILSEKNQYDHIPFFELGRNFWSANRMRKKIAYPSTLEMDMPTAFASTMRFLSMTAGELQGGEFDWQPFDVMRQRYESMIDLYLADPTQNWQNTLGSGQPQANNPSRLGAQALAASFLLRLHRDFGQRAFLTRFWREVANRPDAVTNQDAVDNFFLAACAAAGRNLTTLFSDQWRWPLSANARSQATQYPAR